MLQPCFVGHWGNIFIDGIPSLTAVFVVILVFDSLAVDNFHQVTLTTFRKSRQKPEMCNVCLTPVVWVGK